AEPAEPVTFKAECPVPPKSTPLVLSPGRRTSRKASVNVAVQCVSSSSITIPVEQPASPLHPENTEFGPGVGRSVTLVPRSNNSAQSPGQAIPPGVLLTVPLPVPAIATAKVARAGGEMNTPWVTSWSEL